MPTTMESRPTVSATAVSTRPFHRWADGKAIWSFDTARPFTTVNGVEATGGGINAAGPVVAGGMVYLTSGYSDLGGGSRGNVLLAFGVQ